MSPVPAGPDGSDPLRGTRIAASVLLGCEVLGLLVIASYALAVLGRAPEVPVKLGLGLGAFLALFALLLAVAVVSLLRGGRFGVGWGITWQLFQALVAASMLRSALYIPGAAALGLAIASFVLLLRLARSTPTPLERD